MKQVRTVQLLTKEGEKFLADKNPMPWNIYPRPHLRRDSFFSLNGEWDIKICENGTNKIEKITVPFVPESVLSGIGRRIAPKSVLYYKKEFSLPKDFVPENYRVILHFGAVDQIANVSLNSHFLGEHRGGYDAFSFDVTEYLSDVNTLEIEVHDELENGILPYGKQCEKRGGMWYTPISGIWQTVWLEAVPKSYIKDIKIVTDESGADVYVEGDGELCGMVELGYMRYYLKNGHARIEIKDPVFWTPENPHLYEIAVRVGIDRAESYFAFRTLEVKEINGKKRLCLNGKPYFFHGLLDQGYFPDGIFLPADPSGFERDITEAKKLGFNMLRKHIKIEPEIFYYYCDKLGIVVFQDMVNNSDYSFFRDTALPTVGIKSLDDKKMHRDPRSRKTFIDAMEKTVKKLSFHPSICYWTIFNEGWGQFDHAAAYERLKELDGSRFIDSVSGWFLPKKKQELASDVESLHVYFKPVKTTERSAEEKPLVLSEFGGYSYKIEGHSFNLDKNYGYRTIKDAKEFEAALEKLYFEEVAPAIGKGLCAAVYTQLTDVEDETNGLLSYDRKVVKVSYEAAQNIAKKLFGENE